MLAEGASYCCRPAGTSSESTEAVPGAMMRTMTEWLETARAELNRLELPGWLIYDFRGLNRIAGPFLRLGPGMLTRRVFLFVPAEGRPTLLVHAIERGSLPADLPVDVRSYSSHGSLRSELQQLLPQGRVALEYSPENAIPYLSFVDGGTLELLRSLGVEPVSSGELLQAFSAWDDAQAEAHRQAARHLLTAKDEACAWIDARLRARNEVRAAQGQDVRSGHFAAHGLARGSTPASVPAMRCVRHRCRTSSAPTSTLTGSSTATRPSSVSRTTPVTRITRRSTVRTGPLLAATAS